MPISRNIKGASYCQTAIHARVFRNSCKLFIMLSLLSVQAHGQLSTYIDDRGIVVFTNADSPAPPVILSESKTSSSEKPQTVSGASPAGARLATPEALDRIVLRSAQKHRVDPKLIRAVTATESNWNSRAVSRSGAHAIDSEHSKDAGRCECV